MNHKKRLKTILVAEDDPNDCILVERAFQRSGESYNLVFVHDGFELLQYLRHQDRFTEPPSHWLPDLILLDLNMPHLDGRKTLAQIKSDPDLRSIPVVVLSNSTSEDDVMLTYDQGGAGFITKPSIFEEMIEVVKTLNQYWFEVVLLSEGEYVNRFDRKDSVEYP